MSEDRPRDRLDDEAILAHVGAALGANGVDGDAAHDPSAPGPSAALHARVLAAAEHEVFGEPSRVARLWPRRRAIPFIPAALASVAIAASFALWGRTRDGDLAVPPYEAEIATADAEMRGAEAPADACATCGVLRVSGERFVLVVRPKVAPSAPVSVRARAFLFRAGNPVPWNPPLDVGADGVVRIAGTRSDILLEGQGELEVVVAVANAGRLPTDALAARRAVASPTPGLRAVSLRFIASPEP